MIRHLFATLALLVAVPVVAQDPTAVDAQGLALSAKAGVAAHTAVLSPTAAPIANTRNRVPLTYFGVKYDGTDQTANLNTAFASGVPLFCDNTVSAVGPIVLQNGMDFEGSSVVGCTIKALSSSVPTFVTEAVGQLQHINLRYIKLQGLTYYTPTASRSLNAGQNGLLLTCQESTSTNNGGIWYSTFEHISVRGFDGISFGLEGGGSDYLCPHQWLYLNDIDVERPLGTSGPGLYMTGQVEHIHFDTFRFDGNGTGAEPIGGTDMYMGRAFPSRALGSGTATSDVAPRVVTFTNGSFQNANLAATVDRSENVEFNSTWLEQLNNGIVWQNSCRGMMLNTRFANAAKAASTGTALTVNSGCRVTERDSLYNGTTTRSAVTDGSGSLYQGGSMQGGLGLTTNVIPTLTIPTGTTQLNMASARGVFLLANASGISINALASDLAPGEMFFIQMQGQGTNSIAIASGGSYPYNIKLATGTTSVSMAPGETHFFMRSTVQSGWLYMGKM